MPDAARAAVPRDIAHRGQHAFVEGRLAGEAPSATLCRQSE
jgi:hypothetical protein